MSGQAKRARDAVVRADEAVTHRLAQARDHPLARAAGLVAEVADQPPLLALSAATIVAGRLAWRGDLLRAGTRMLAAELLATGIKTAIKKVVERARPEHALDTGDRRFRPGDSDRHEHNAFPSGHTAGAVAVALALSRELDGAALPAGLAASAVALAQPPAGKHYIADVLAGAAVGLAAEAVVNAGFRAAQRRVARSL